MFSLLLQHSSGFNNYQYKNTLSYQSTIRSSYFAHCSRFSEEWGRWVAERPAIEMKGTSVISHYALGHNLITSCSQKISLSLVFNRTKFVTFWWGGEEEGYVFGWSSAENNITSNITFWSELNACIRYALATCQLTESAALFKSTPSERDTEKTRLKLCSGSEEALSMKGDQAACCCQWNQWKVTFW